jgi:hypothetical protein
MRRELKWSLCEKWKRGVKKNCKGERYFFHVFPIELWLKRIMHLRVMKLKSRPEGKLKSKVFEDRLLRRTLGSMGNKVTEKLKK